MVSCRSGREGGVQRAVGIEPRQIAAALSIRAGESPTDEDPAVRLHCQGGHRCTTGADLRAFQSSIKTVIRALAEHGLRSGQGEPQQEPGKPWRENTPARPVAVALAGFE